MILWTGPEMASGILAMCLPVSPKFFQGLKKSKLGTSLQSLFRGKSDTNLNLGIQSDERKTAKNYVSAFSRKYRFLSDEIPNEHSLGELSTSQILRTTQIVTTSDRDAASIEENPGNGTYNVWYKKHYIRFFFLKNCSSSFSRAINGANVFDSWRLWSIDCHCSDSLEYLLCHVEKFTVCCWISVFFFLKV